MDNTGHRGQPARIEVQCFSYYGFGGGVALQRGEHPPSGEIYCAICPLRQPCWEAHRERVRELYPAAVAEFDCLLSKHLNNGAEAVKEMVTEHRTEPYMAVMAGNLEDGSRVSAGMAPKARGRGTLAFPFR